LTLGPEKITKYAESHMCITPPALDAFTGATNLKKFMRRLDLTLPALLLAFSFWAAGPGRAGAQSVTLNPAQDTFISEYISFSEPNGSAADMVIGTQGANVGFKKSRGLIQFDVSSIPAGAVVTFVTLRLTATRSPLSPAASDFHLHRMLRPWDGLESTWSVRLDPDENWETPGGQPGTDYAEASSASVHVTGTGGYTFGSTSGLVADVNAWLANPASNHGWLVKTEDESVAFTARRWSSREAASGAPVLEVQFEPAAPPVSISSTAIVGTDFCLRFNARPGKSYVVERRERVDSGSWDVVTTLPPAAEAGEVAVCDALGAGPRFYRVGEQ
jgi:hypothetical protein